MASFAGPYFFCQGQNGKFYVRHTALFLSPIRIVENVYSEELHSQFLLLNNWLSISSYIRSFGFLSSFVRDTPKKCRVAKIRAALVSQLSCPVIRHARKLARWRNFLR